MSTTASQKAVLKDQARLRREAELAAGGRPRPVVFADRKKVARRRAARGRSVSNWKDS